MTIFAASLLSVLAFQSPDAYRLNSEGRVLLDQHRYSAAARVFRKAADRADSEFGPNDPATAMILRNLALAYVHTGNSRAAEVSAKIAYSILEARFGSGDPALVPALNVLAECYAATGRIDDAKRASEQAVSLGPSAGVHYGTALHNLAALREFSGDLEGAASLYRRAIEVKSEALGAEHPYIALSRTALRRIEHRAHFNETASSR